MVVDSTCFNIFHEVKNLDSKNLDLSIAENLEVEPKLCITRANQNEELETVNEVIDVPVIKSPFEANVLHKLAAKKIISQLVADMKEVNYNAKEGIKKEIIDISVKEQVLSPHTALIGVADEATVTGVSQRVEVESLSDPYGGRRMMQRSMMLGSSIGGSNMIRCSAAPRMEMKTMMAAPQSYSLSMDSYSRRKSSNLKCKKMSSRSPGLFSSISNSLSNSFGSSSKRGSSSKIETLKARLATIERCEKTSEDNLQLESNCGFDSLQESFATARSSRAVPPKPISKPISDNYQTITNAQDPSGFWLSSISIDLDPANGKLILTKFSDEQISATIYALILLLSRFGSQYNEWKLTAIKGVSFLKSKLGEDVVDKFNEILGELVGVVVADDMVDELFE